MRSESAANPADKLARLEGRADRERRARVAAEDLLEAKSRELYETNEQLKRLAAQLEVRVEERTKQLSEAHKRAVELVERDLLTNLPNRARFARVSEQMMEDAIRNGTRAAFVSIDVDRFKDINDSLGHEAGDAVLQHVAIQFQNAIRVTDMVARMGGDEFCAVFSNISDATEVATIVERMVQAVREPVLWRGKNLFVQTSIGYAIYPDHGENLDDVLRHADIALYRSKTSGRGIYTAFNNRMSDELKARQTLEAELRHALESGGMEPWFQPVIDLESGLPCGAEALVRWRRGKDQIVSPGSFINIIEECGLMPKLFETVLRSTLEFARPLIDNHILRYVTVNVSPSQFKLDTLPQEVISELEATGFPPGALVLEITEEVLLADLDRASSQLNQLAAYGVRFALDDFGNGYANIGYLRRLPIHKLKLDRLLTADVAHDSKAFAIVSAVARLAGALDLALIAEGIESDVQAKALHFAGCKFVQGFHYARPMAPDQFGAYLLRTYSGSPQAIPD